MTNGGVVLTAYLDVANERVYVILPEAFQFRGARNDRQSLFYLGTGIMLSNAQDCGRIAFFEELGKTEEDMVLLLLQPNVAQKVLEAVQRGPEPQEITISLFEYWWIRNQISILVDGRQLDPPQ